MAQRARRRRGSAPRRSCPRRDSRRRCPEAASSSRAKSGHSRWLSQGQRQQRLLARLGLDRGREHPGRGPARAVAGLALVVDGDRAARLREAPGQRQPDDAGADDDGARPVRRLGGLCGDDGLPSPGTARPGSVGLISAAPTARSARRGSTPASPSISGAPEGDARIFFACRALPAATREMLTLR